MTEPVIQVRDLVKRYDGRTTILDCLTFSLDEGEFATVYGKSGCGKTTLLNILGGLDRPTSGSVRIGDTDIVRMSEDELAALRLKKIGFVFQDFNLLLDMTVRENISLPLKLGGDRDEKKVDSLLERFDISHIADENARRISGGEAQRTAIARAIVNEPVVILADEPTGNLDAENTQKVIAMFQSIRNEYGTTIVLATHDEDLATHASKTMHLDNHKLMERQAGRQ